MLYTMREIEKAYPIARRKFLDTELGRNMIDLLNDEHTLQKMEEMVPLYKPPVMAVLPSINRLLDSHQPTRGDKQCIGMLISTFMKLRGYIPKGDHFKKSVQSYTPYLNMAMTFQKPGD